LPFDAEGLDGVGKKLSLEFLAAQMEKLLSEQRAIRQEQAAARDDMTVLLGMVQRLEGTVLGLVTEVRAMHSRHARLEQRVSDLEKERN
jgi:predicted  nucleic acid-binding Zn-ribbon protein